MKSHVTNIETTLIVAFFALSYLTIILRKVGHRQLDLYDLFMLSAVAVVPVVFTIPSFGDFISKISGVAFPFVVMFGILIAIMFIFIHQLTSKVRVLEIQNRRLIQELSLLSLESRMSSSNAI